MSKKLKVRGRLNLVLILGLIAIVVVGIMLLNKKLHGRFILGTSSGIDIPSNPYPNGFQPILENVDTDDEGYGEED